MNSILISSSYHECSRIASGEQTILIRKTAPKDTTFKVYIYCTNYGVKDLRCLVDKTKIVSSLWWSGKVIGEFICDEVEKFTIGSLRSDDIEKFTCLTYEELIKYFYKPCELDGNTVKFGYALHIRDFKIYDNPKDISDFNVVDKDSIKKCEYRQRVGQPKYVTCNGGWIKGSWFCSRNDDWCINCKLKQLSSVSKPWMYIYNI